MPPDEANSPNVVAAPNYVVTPQGVMPEPPPAVAPPAPVIQPGQTVLHESQPVLNDPVPVEFVEPERKTADVMEVRIYGHSNLFYWWPVWAVGYLAAAVTYFNGAHYAIGGAEQTDMMHPSSSLGVAFFLTLFLVILITNVSVRGLASAIVIMAAAVVVLLFMYFQVWDTIFGWVAGLRIHLNSGAYFWFSTLMFLSWAFSTFIVDHMSYYRIKPGQITHDFILGAASKSYDTQNLVLEKYRDDLFRHWVLGFGSGDLRIETSGARHEELLISNVLFLGSKVQDIQNLIAMKPDEFGAPVIG